MKHISCMPEEVIEFININSEGTYLDGTFGEGGHSRLMLLKGAGRVISLDRDTAAIGRCSADLLENDRFELRHARFSDYAQACDTDSLDGVLLDLGPSTRQLLEGERGFSYSREGVADLRMDQSHDLSLKERIQKSTPKELGEYLQVELGLKGGRNLARKVFELYAREESPTTSQLAALVHGVPGKKNPATELFLGLRIWVNDEMGEIARALPEFVRALKPGGRLVVLTFHSTEDALVKRVFQRLSGKPEEGLTLDTAPEPVVRLVNRKPVAPSRNEIRRNPRSRSTKLRCVEKLGSKA